jgi:hypothetical protein
MKKEKEEQYIRPISIYKSDKDKVKSFDNFSEFIRFCIRNPEIKKQYDDYKNTQLI